MMNIWEQTRSSTSATASAAPADMNDEARRTSLMDKFTGCHYTAIDTSIWMMEIPVANLFFDRLEASLRRTGKSVWAPEEVRLELVKQAAGTGNPEKAAMARNGLERFDRMASEGLIDVYAALNENGRQNDFCDKVLLGQCTWLRVNNQIGVITLDNDLAEDLMNLNRQKSVSGHSVPVKRVTSSGWLGCFVPMKSLSEQPPRGGILRFSSSAPATAEADVRIDAKPVCEGDRLLGSDGVEYAIGEEIGSGGEATIWSEAGDPRIAIKTFETPTTHKFAKVKMLCERAFDVEGVVFPTALLTDGAGQFVGYAMRRIDGVAIERLFTTRGMEKNAPEFDRRHYARLAARIAHIVSDLHNAGMLLGDINGGNFLVGRSTDGKLDPGLVYCVDIDSAQFGTARTGLYAPDGLTLEYASPEVLVGGANSATLRTIESERFSLALFALQVVLCGIHPYRARRNSEEEADISLPEAIVAQQFPFSSGEDRRSGISPSGAEKLWSNMNGPLKKFFYDILQKDRPLNAPQARPKAHELAGKLDYYASWVADEANLLKYPELRSVAPENLKPFYAKCANTACARRDEPFNVSLGLRWQDGWLCPDCLGQPAGLCRSCGAPVMTRRDMIEQRRQRAPVLCPACYERAKAIRQTSIDHYSTCPACRQAYPVTVADKGKEEICPRCGAQASPPPPSDPQAQRHALIKGEIDDIVQEMLSQHDPASRQRDWRATLSERLRKLLFG